uniref:Uncharacterized protein n=1 Tax=Megaselia scalaris TaxID=36166 RepID=T1GR64_MEGSC
MSSGSIGSDVSVWSYNSRFKSIQNYIQSIQNYIHINNPEKIATNLTFLFYKKTKNDLPSTTLIPTWGLLNSMYPSKLLGIICSAIIQSIGFGISGQMLLVYKT